MERGAPHAPLLAVDVGGVAAQHGAGHLQLAEGHGQVQAGHAGVVAAHDVHAGRVHQLAGQLLVVVEDGQHQGRVACTANRA